MTNITKILEKMENNNSIFENAVRVLETPTCPVFKSGNQLKPVLFDKEGEELGTKDKDQVNKSFKNIVAQSNNKVLFADKSNPQPAKGKKVAVLFSGGPAAGGHNVVVGLKRILGKDNTLFGVKAGPKGLLAGDLFEIKDADVDRIVNTGGFDFLGSDRTKIKKR